MISLNEQRIYTGRGLSRAVPAASRKLFGVYVGGNRKDWRSQIEVVAASMKEAREKTWTWLGDRGRETKLSVTGLVGWTGGNEVPPTSHPLYQSANRPQIEA